MASSSSATDSKIEYPTRALVRDLWIALKGKLLLFIIGSCLRLCATVLWLYPAFAFSRVVSELSHGISSSTIWWVWFFLLSWVGVLTVANTLNFIANNIVFRITNEIKLKTEVSALEHLLHLDSAWHEKENAGNKIKKIDRGSNSMGDILEIWYNQILQILVSFVGALIIISAFDFTVTGIMLGFIAIYYFVSMKLTKATRAAVKDANIAEEELGGLEYEAVDNVRTIKVLGMNRSMMRLVLKSVDVLYKKIMRRMFCFTRRTYVLDSISVIFRTLSLAYIIIGIIHGTKDVGFLVLFFGYYGSIESAVVRFAEMTQNYMIGRQSITRLKEITNTPINIDAEIGKKQFPKQWKRLALSHVTFRYHDNIVLNDISLEINRGEKIGIIGLSGAGKSTLFKLLLKEYEDFEGDIFVDNISLKTIRRSDYLLHVAAVMQETEVFNFTLKENIMIANPSVRHGDKVFLDRAMKTAHVTDFIKKLPEGADTMIGEKGVKLSGGEKQRLGIARAIFKRPEILFLDEATSHLDLESEEKIRDSLHKFFKDITAVVIAHRLTTIKEMDRIIVLEGGRIIEQGTFDQLMKQEGRFYTLWQKQQL